MINDEDVGNDAAAVVFCAPSLVPNYNPAVRIYDVDTNTSVLNDYSQYYMDLDKLNSNSGPSGFQLEYTAKATYGLKVLFEI